MRILPRNNGNPASTETLSNDAVGRAVVVGGIDRRHRFSVNRFLGPLDRNRRGPLEVVWTLVD